MKKIKFSKHALRRATERRLWEYVNKDKFFYDAKYLSNNKAMLNDCIYAFVETDTKIIITTMYKLAFK